MFRLEDHLDAVRAAVRTQYAVDLDRLGVDVDDFVGDVVLLLVRRQGTPGAFHCRPDEPVNAYGTPRRFYGYVVRMANPMIRDLRAKTNRRRRWDRDLIQRMPRGRDQYVDESARLEAREELRRSRT
jgi:hypothetical protein